ncbi:hypothetical protein C8J57DRAFT_1495476 [Mycena rebaudengoi]|nr:hypothetical protein C8J57DRAFT_1495476 [Mycena rebaudengoi]
MSTIYVGNLSLSTTSDSLRQAFTQFGTIQDCIVMLNRSGGSAISRSFGLITFASAQEADAAINAMSDQELDGRQIRVSIAGSRDPSSYVN